MKKRLNSTQVCDLLAISKTQLARFRERKINPIPFRQFSENTYRYDLDELEQWDKLHKRMK